jgi:hypothetical protein
MPIRTTDFIPDWRAPAHGHGLASKGVAETPLMGARQIARTLQPRAQLSATFALRVSFF